MTAPPCRRHRARRPRVLGRRAGPSPSSQRPAAHGCGGAVGQPRLRVPAWFLKLEMTDAAAATPSIREAAGRKTGDANVRPLAIGNAVQSATIHPPSGLTAFALRTACAREPLTNRSGRDGRFRYRTKPQSAATHLPQGGKNPGNLVPRAEDHGRLSFWESLDASLAGAAVFLPGDEHMVIDANLLPAGSVVVTHAHVPLGRGPRLHREAVDTKRG